MSRGNNRRWLALDVPRAVNSSDQIDLALCWLRSHGLQEEMLRGDCKGQIAGLLEKAKSLCVGPWAFELPFDGNVERVVDP